MNSKKSIALLAVIAAVAMSTISLADISAVPLMVSAVPQNHESTGILGHVEYTVMDSNGQVKGYIQGDNAVTDDGKDCVSNYMFGVTGTGSCSNDPTVGTDNFIFVAIGNYTTGAISGTYSDLRELESTGTDLCADTGANGGEISRKEAVVTLDTAADGTGTTGAVIVLDTKDSPFTFTAANATTTNTIEQSAIFNADYITPNNNRECLNAAQAGAGGTNWNMFAIQTLNSGNGIDVTEGDSLSVKWTLTVG